MYGYESLEITGEWRCVKDNTQEEEK